MTVLMLTTLLDVLLYLLVFFVPPSSGQSLKHSTSLKQNWQLHNPPCSQGRDIRTAEAGAIALRAAADAEYAARVGSFPRDLFGARLKASFEELQPRGRKTARPPAKQPTREPLLVKTEAKVRRGCGVGV